MKRKKYLSVVSVMFAVMLLFSLPCQAVLNWNSISDWHPTFQISGNTAMWDLTVTTADSTDTIRASVYLYRVNSNGSDTMLDSWTLLDGVGRLEVSGSYPNLTSGTYRLSCSIYVDGSGGEDFVGDDLFATKR